MISSCLLLKIRKFIKILEETQKLYKIKNLKHKTFLSKTDSFDLGMFLAGLDY